MKKLVVLIIFGCFLSNTYAQRLMSKNGNPAFSKDTTSFNNESIIKLDGSTKYTDYSGRGDNTPIIRWAEVLLNQAEAEASGC